MGVLQTLNILNLMYIDKIKPLILLDSNMLNIDLSRNNC